MIYTEGSKVSGIILVLLSFASLYPQLVLIGASYWFGNWELSDIINSNHGNSNLIANNH
jgi:hypothetical protein